MPSAPVIDTPVNVAEIRTPVLIAALAGIRHPDVAKEEEQSQDAAAPALVEESSSFSDEDLQITPADFVMDFQFDSNDDDDFGNQIIEKSNTAMDLVMPSVSNSNQHHQSNNCERFDRGYSNGPLFIAENDGMMDFGMYTRTKDSYQCVYCHDAFDSRAALLVHKTCYFLRKGVEAINSGGRPFTGDRYTFTCESEGCHLILQDLQALKLHMMTHWGGMFECKQCSYKTPGEAHMRQHLITHTGE